MSFESEVYFDGYSYLDWTCPYCDKKQREEDMWECLPNNGDNGFEHEVQCRKCDSELTICISGEWEFTCSDASFDKDTIKQVEAFKASPEYKPIIKPDPNQLELGLEESLQLIRRDKSEFTTIVSEV